jgi:hypothetical protein
MWRGRSRTWVSGAAQGSRPTKIEVLEPEPVPFGAGDGIRTRDINLGKVALYQLSYSRLGGGYSTFSDDFVVKVNSTDCNGGD